MLGLQKKLFMILWLFKQLNINRNLTGNYKNIRKVNKSGKLIYSE